MGFFKKDKQIMSGTKKPLFDCGIDIRKDNWCEVFSTSLGKIMANQQVCSDLVVKGQNWNVDLSAGTISFGKDQYPLQFIGSESTSSNSWLWGWKNINHFPDAIIELSNQTKKAGKTIGLDALTTTELELSDMFNGHNLSIVTCAVSDKYFCYYRCPHSNGAIFVAFSNVPNDVFMSVDIHKFISITMDCIQKHHVDHRIFIQSFLYQNDTPYEVDDQTIIAHFKQDLLIDFEQADEFQRIKNMRSI